MKKWLLIILMVLVVQTVCAATQVEISLDNTTFTSITATQYGGVIDDDNDIFTISFLNASTTYYLRAKDDITSWNYLSFTTLPGGIDEMQLAIIIGLIFLVALFIILTIITREDKPFLAHFFFLGIFIFSSILTNFMWRIAYDAGAVYEPVMLIVYRVILIITWLMIMLVLLILTNEVVQIKKIKGTANDNFKDNLK